MTNEYQAVEIMESVKVRHQLSWFVQGNKNQHNWKWHNEQPPSELKKVSYVGME
jgi:hypothetical protein